MIDIGRAIRIARERRGLTLRQLAARSGLSAAPICRWEAGKTTPRWQELCCVAKGLGVRPSRLVAAAEEL